MFCVYVCLCMLMRERERERERCGRFVRAYVCVLCYVCVWSGDGGSAESRLLMAIIEEKL